MINAETGYCSFPLCARIAERNGFCFLHAAYYGGPKPEKEKTAIPKESKKRKEEKKAYKKIVVDKIKTSGGLCVLKGPTCSKIAQGGDHKQNRSPKNYADPDNIVPACNNCNTLKVQKPELFPGFVVSRFKK